MCPIKDFNITLKGSFSSKEAKFMEVQIDYCTPEYLEWKFPGMKKKCKSKEEANKIIKNIQIYVPVLTMYFDQYSFNGSSVKS